ncbi:hypothetical protein [Clostridium sp. UBA1056]|uniref:hypothetical protein n=1 Tax=unclassified Clostridium TaxID=2614128 RepID=UPI003217E188
MYRIRFKQELYSYMINILTDELKNKIENIEYKDDVVYLNIDVDTKLDIMEYVEDKQLEIGFVNEDYLNEDGKKLQMIYDIIYNQTNSQ